MKGMRGAGYGDRKKPRKDERRGSEGSNVKNILQKEREGGKNIEREVKKEGGEKDKKVTKKGKNEVK